MYTLIILSTFTLLCNYHQYLSLELTHHLNVKKNPAKPWLDTMKWVAVFCMSKYLFHPVNGSAHFFSFHTTLEKLVEWYNPLIVSLDPNLPWLLLLHFKRCIQTLNKQNALFMWPSYWESSILLSLYNSSTFYSIYWCLMFSLLANVVFPAVHGN